MVTSWACALADSCPARLQCVMDKGSCETWGGGKKKEYSLLVTCFSATGSTVYISVFPVSAFSFLMVFIVPLLGFSSLNCLISHITAPVTAWSSLCVC